MLKNTLLYLFITGLLGLGIYTIIEIGPRFMPVAAASTGQVSSAETGRSLPGTPIEKNLIANLTHPLSLLLMQVIVITLAAHGLGVLFSRLGQPAVIGEMLAGILLGPSLLGWLVPQGSAFLFPATSLGTLQVLSQVGVIVFMFLVGMELNIESLSKRAHSAVLISHAGILVPFVLGVGLSLAIYPSTAPAGISFQTFALFMGIAMSITAFPVLARIIEQRGLSGSHLGNMAIACAATDDVTAWCLLAVVLSIAQSTGLASAAVTIGLTISFIGIMLFVVRPMLSRMAARVETSGTGSKSLVIYTLLFAFISALFTETIGIHALFGAFLAGVVLPPLKVLRVAISERLETFTAFLLPLFFAFTGLRTQIGLLNDWEGWLLCLAIIATAVAGKLGGSTLAARLTGLGWHESLSIGALMNTRGLMELIVINIGYDLGILSARVFAMMVLMALATTLMTGPILSILKHWQNRGMLEGSENKVTT